MTHRLRFLALSVLAGMLIQNVSGAQTQTVGLFLEDAQATEGYTILPPLFHNTTYLIDNRGKLVNSWEHGARPGGATYLLPSGNLLRGAFTPNSNLNFGGLGGTIEEIAWDGEVVWEFLYSDSLKALHHDYAMMPGGNVLMLAWEFRSYEEAVAAGRDPGNLPDSMIWSEQIIEVQPTRPSGGEIVWKWHVWDHLIQDFDSTKANYGVVGDHPELIDLNFGESTTADWLHHNALNYNAELDQIAISVPGLHEMWVIDHSTSMEEAATHEGGDRGKGGDLLYRWGNPASYRAGEAADRRLHFQHDVQWIEPGLPGEGHFMIFDNGVGLDYSTVLELIPPTDGQGDYTRDPDGSFSDAEVAWSYSDPETFNSRFASGAQRLWSGNTWIAEAMTGRIFEVTPEGETVWMYINPVTDQGPIGQSDSLGTIPRLPPWIQPNSIFRAYHYPPDFAGLQGKDLTPKGDVQTSIEGEYSFPQDFVLNQNYPNPFHSTTAIEFVVPRAGLVQISVYNVLGQEVATLAGRHFHRGNYSVRFEAGGLTSGVYLYRLTSGGFAATKTMLLVR